MRVLAIETIDRHRVVGAVLDESGHAGREVHDSSVDRALPPLLSELVAGGGLDAVVVAVGPGSYTGVRAGMAAAAGIAQAASIPLFGVGALEVVAWGAPAAAAHIHAVIDAGRGGLYVADYRREADRLVADRGPRRVEAAGHLPPAGALVAALPPVPAAVAATAIAGDPVTALVGAARAAIRGASLDLATLRPLEVADAAGSADRRV